VSGPSNRQDQKERRDVIRNDLRLRPGDHEPSTLHQQAMIGLELENTGRHATGTIITGSQPASHYPRAAGPWADAARVPDEPPLGFCIDDQPACGEAFEVEKSRASLGGADEALTAATSAAVVETSAPPILQNEAVAKLGELLPKLIRRRNFK
jgi:hypothetical protein